MNFFLVLILFFLAIAFVLRVDFVFYVLYVCAGVWLWSRFAVPRLLRKVRVTRVLPGHVFWNESFAGEIVVENPTWLPLPWLEIRESVALELRLGDGVDTVLALPGRQTRRIRYPLLAKRRGFYRVGPLQLATSDVFGLGELVQATVPAGYVTVYPRLHPLQTLGIPSRLPFGTLPTGQRLFEDPARPMGVRTYRSGDSLRQINWKVSAHQRDLMVKTYQPAMSLDAAVMLDLSLTDYMRQDRQAYVEWAVELAASLAAHLVDLRQAVGFGSNGYDPLQGMEEGLQFDDSGRLARPAGDAAGPPPVIPPRTGRAHLMKLLEQLARLETTETVPFVPWLATACQGLSWGTAVLVISPAPEEGLTAVLHRFVRSGLNPVLIVVNPLSETALADLQQRARRLGFTVAYLPTVHELTAWQV